MKLNASAETIEELAQSIQDTWIEFVDEEVADAAEHTIQEMRAFAALLRTMR